MCLIALPFLMVEDRRNRTKSILSQEKKLSLVLTLYKYCDFQEAIDKVERHGYLATQVRGSFLAVSIPFD